MRPSGEIRYIDIAEFRKRGYLQEVNRRFFHPLGLALEVVQEDDGSEHLGGVWDYRDDPEGMRFAEGMIELAKAEAIDRELERKAKTRAKGLGYLVQPVGAAGQA